MKFEVHHYHHYPRDPAIAQEIAELRYAVLSLRTLLENSMSDIDDFLNRAIADISAQKTQIAGLTSLVSSLKHQVGNALQGESLSSVAKDKLAAIFPAIEANTADIVTAINANTDAAPAPTPAVDPAPPASTPAPTPAASTASQTSST